MTLSCLFEQLCENPPTTIWTKPDWSHRAKSANGLWNNCREAIEVISWEFLIFFLNLQVFLFFIKTRWAAISRGSENLLQVSAYHRLSASTYLGCWWDNKHTVAVLRWRISPLVVLHSTVLKVQKEENKSPEFKKTTQAHSWNTQREGPSARRAANQKARFIWNPFHCLPRCTGSKCSVRPCKL